MKTIHDHDHIAEVLVANPLLGHRAIAKLTGASRTAVWNVARGRGIKQQTVSFPPNISTATEAAIIQMLGRGATYGEIAAAPGLSQATAYKVARGQHQRGAIELPAHYRESIRNLVHSIVSCFQEQIREAMFEAQESTHKSLKKLIGKYGSEAIQAALEECAGGAATHVDVSLDLERELKFLLTGGL